MFEPDAEQPRGLSRRHDQAWELEKLTAKAKGVAIRGFGEGDHGQTSFQRLPNCRGNDSVEHRSIRSGR